MDDIDQPLGWVHNNAWLVLKLQLIVRDLDIILLNKNKTLKPDLFAFNLS